MNYVEPLSAHTTIAQDEKRIQELKDLRNSMVGNLYPHAVSEDIAALERQLEAKKRLLKNTSERVSAMPILEMYYRCMGVIPD